MKKFFILMILIMGVFATAKAQAGNPQDPKWCTSCSPIEKQQMADKVNGKDGFSTNDDPGFIPRQRTDQRSISYVIDVRFPVKNESDKEIKRITWEYTVANRETKTFIQTVTFVTKKTIAPHQSAVLKEKVGLPLEKLAGPTVSVGQAGQKPAHKVEIEENYQIKEIMYADGTVRTP